MTMPLLRVLLFKALLLGMLMFAAAAARGQDPAVSEQALKAVLFYKLPPFVYAASGADKRVTLLMCTLGESPLGGNMHSLPGQLADGRRVEFKGLPSGGDIGECEFIFIGRSESGLIDSVLRRAQGRRVVTVSDIEGFALAGGMVEFALRGDGSGIQILINRKAAQKQGIEFNAQLLRLARIVEP